MISATPVTVGSIDGIDMSKVSSEAVGKAFKRLGLNSVPNATLLMKVTAIVKHLQTKYKPNKLVACDNCGGRSPLSLEACPFCGDVDPGSVKEEPTTAMQVAPEPSTKIIESYKKTPVKIDGVTVEVMPTEETLDEVVAKCRALGAEALGRTREYLLYLYEHVEKPQLWKLRKDDKGRVKYKSSDQFYKAELGVGGKQARDNMRIAQRYNDVDIKEFGWSKLRLALQSSEPDKVLAEFKKGRTLHEVNAELHPNQKLQTRKFNPSKHITISSIVGEVTIPFYTQSTNGGEPVPARTLKGVPFATLDLVNDVRMTFEISETPTGELQLSIKTKRVKE